MSVDVLREVFRSSRSKGVARNVLTVLADAAHPDGVTWLPIVASTKSGADPSKSIAHRANASKRAVIDALQSLEELGEIEARKAQRGRQRINVYRVTLGTLAAASVDYADVPFELDRPFSDGVQILHLVDTGDEVQSARDEVQFPQRRGADFVSPEGAKIAGFAGASLIAATPKPEPEPSTYPRPEQAAARGVSALVDESLGVGRSSVEGLLELLPPREVARNTRAVLERKFSQLPGHFVGLAREELLAAGDTPRSRVKYLNGIADRMIAEAGRRETPSQAREWVREHREDPDVHRVIDSWDDVDTVERAQLHEIADEESTTTAGEAAA